VVLQWSFILEVWQPLDTPVASQMMLTASISENINRSATGPKDARLYYATCAWWCYFPASTVPGIIAVVWHDIYMYVQTDMTSMFFTFQWVLLRVTCTFRSTYFSVIMGQSGFGVRCDNVSQDNDTMQLCVINNLTHVLVSGIPHPGTPTPI